MQEWQHEPKNWEVETYWGKLAGCIPRYLEGCGDVTEIILTDGTSLFDSRPIPYVIESIANYTGSNITSLRGCYGEIIGRKKQVPLPLSLSTLFMPCQCRTPRVSSDSATGYIVYHHIREVKPLGSRESLILLANGREIHCYQSVRYVEEQRRRAFIVEVFFKKRMLGEMER